MTKTATKTNTLDAFGVGDIQNNSGILVPEMTISVRADCQIGSWKLVEDAIPGDIKMSIIKVGKFYGAFSDAIRPTEFMQLWFVAEEGNLPKDTVMVTYVKTESLRNLNNLLITLIAKRINPSSGVFIPKFNKKEKMLLDETGKSSKASYYCLTWTWEPRTDDARASELSAVVSEPTNQLKMIDDSISGRLVLLGEQEEPASLPPQEEVKQLEGNPIPF